MSVNIDYRTGKVTQLDIISEGSSLITENDVKDSGALVRALMFLIREIDKIRGRWRPHRIDFHHIVSTGTSGSPETFRLKHGFNSDVVWWPVDCQLAGTVVVPLIMRSDPQDANTLTLAVYYPATLTIRVEAAG